MVKTSGMVPGLDYFLSNVNSVFHVLAYAAYGRIQSRDRQRAGRTSRAVDDRKASHSEGARSNGCGVGSRKASGRREGEAWENRMERQHDQDEQPPED